MMRVKTIWELCLFEVRPFGSLWRLQMGIFTFLTERDWSRKSCYGNSTRCVILFLFWCTFVVPSFKNNASIFPEISFIQYFPLLSCKQYDVITDLICILEKPQYLNQEKNCAIIVPSRARAWFENKRFDWLSVNFFVHWPIRMLALLPFLHSITSFLHCVKEKLHCSQPIRIK